MGLDIEISWYGMTKDERDAQLTGYKDAPEVGYLRFNWSGVRAVTSFCKEQDLTIPIPLFQVWDGNNGESVPITPVVVEYLTAQKMSMAHNIKEFDFGAWGELGEYVKEKIENSIKLIEFIELHAGKPGLTIEFN